MAKAFEAVIKFDTSKLEKELLSDFGIGSYYQHRWTELVYKGSENYTPFKTGALTESPTNSGVPFSSGEIVYTVPWAAKMWHNPQFNFNRAKHTLAGAFWCTRAERDNGIVWASKLQDDINHARGKGRRA